MILPAIVTVLMLTGGQPRPGQDLSARVEELAQEVAPSVVQWRRDFHAHPELGNREERTAAKVAEQLRAMGVDDLKTGVAHHGVVALIRGRREGPTVALRADMDALPIVEQTGLPFASQNAGVMHACGHDAHTAILLGVARVLVQLRDRLPGAVKLIFQPADGNVIEVEPSMGGDDFARYAQKKPGLYFLLGVRNKAVGAVGALHTPQMVIDEAALPLGVRTLAMLALDSLQRESTSAAKLR